MAAHVPGHRCPWLPAAPQVWIFYDALGSAKREDSCEQLSGDVLAVYAATNEADSLIIDEVDAMRTELARWVWRRQGRHPRCPAGSGSARV
jgi:hypothetical protein